jgi:hypothetical protein
VELTGFEGQRGRGPHIEQPIGRVVVASCGEKVSRVGETTGKLCWLSADDSAPSGGRSHGRKARRALPRWSSTHGEPSTAPDRLRLQGYVWPTDFNVTGRRARVQDLRALTDVCPSINDCSKADALLPWIGCGRLARRQSRPPSRPTPVYAT